MTRAPLEVTRGGTRRTIERSIPRPQPDFEDAERVLHDLGITCILVQQLQPFNGVFDRNEVCCR
jgi:hypothetical protein